MGVTATDKPSALEWAGSRREGLVLAAVILAAFLLRLAGIDFGLPNPWTRPDEHKMVERAVSIVAGDFNPHYFWYPSLYMYVLAALYRVVFLVSAIELPANPVPQSFIYENASLLFLAGRVLAAVVGSATVWLVYKIGKRFFDPRSGLMAAVFLAACYLHVRESHFLTVDIPVTFLIALGLYFILAAAESPGFKKFFIAGASVGAACSIKYNAVVLVVPLLIACFRPRTDEPESLPQKLFSARLLPAGLAMLVVFILGTPYALLDYQEFSSTITRMRGYAWERDFFEPFEYSASVFYLLALRYGLGLLVSLFAVGGMFVWIAKRDRPGIILASFILAYLLIHGMSPTRFSRYLDPVLPLACLAGATALVRGIKYFSGFNFLASEKRQVTMSVVLALALLAEPAWYSIRFDRLLGRQDTRLQAVAWIRENLEPGLIAQVGGRRGYQQALDPHYLPGFRIINIEREAQAKIIAADLATYRDQGFRYAALHDSPLFFSKVRPRVWKKLTDDARQLACFNPFDPKRPPSPLYDQQDQFYLPLARFEGTNRPGPRICIFELPESR